MKNKYYSPYATNKGGKIQSPRADLKSEQPTASVNKGADLRQKSGKSRTK